MTDSPELSVLLGRDEAVRSARGLVGKCQRPAGDLRAGEGLTGSGSGLSQAEFRTWDKKWDQVLQWELPHAKWFVGGRLNASANCVDRHVDAGNGDRVAIHWIGEPEGDTRDITYGQLKDEVCKATNALIALGVKKADRVAIYMPMIPETVFAMLACARLGAPHMVVFAGYSSEALSTRMIDCDAQIVITADGAWRKGAQNALKPAVDEALKDAPGCATCSWSSAPARTSAGPRARRVVARCRGSGKPTAHARVLRLGASAVHIYSSGTTGKPKGVLHTTGGYLTHVSRPPGTFSI